VRDASTSLSESGDKSQCNDLGLCRAIKQSQESA